MKTMKNTPPHALWQSPRVWVAMLPAPLLGIAWIAGDLLKQRPPEYYVIDTGVLLAALLLTVGGYALVRRSSRNAR
jgi:hypothetical protein